MNALLPVPHFLACVLIWKYINVNVEGITKIPVSPSNEEM